MMLQAWQCKNNSEQDWPTVQCVAAGAGDTLCFVTNLKTKLTTSPGGEASAPLGLGVSMSCCLETVAGLLA